ncbi:IclR family transcriptional regulator [Rhodococcus sp. IEGM 1379]|uniref:IclR family transcriptional regulator n=1 Tax=Rhodococcus sp. IEGM 1379 TaxID=3047086 RepID=UPI0024B6C961|nr:IclR family transcriptional regulator [Rhodococcus sp. IEGM 1379]
MRTTRKVDDPISVVDRISAILETFEDSGPLTLSQVSQRTGIARSTAHRLLEQLVAKRWLTRLEHRYELGSKSYELGQWALNQNRLRHGALPVLNRLARSTGLTVHLAAIDSGDTLYLDRVPGRTPLKLPSRVGSRMPAHLTAVGKSILANLDEDKVHGSIPTPLRKLTQYSIDSPEHLQQEFERIRDRGFATDREESVLGIACVATSIGPRDHHYGNRSAISVCGPIGDMKMNQLVSAVRIAARDIWDACVANDLRSQDRSEAS